MGCSGAITGEAATVKMRQGGTWPNLRMQLFGKSSGTPVDLTNAAAVTFVAKRRGSDSTIGGTCTIVAPATKGIVEYAWQDGDTADAGTYDFWFEIVWAGGATGAVPECEPMLVLVVCEGP